MKNKNFAYAKKMRADKFPAEQKKEKKDFCDKIDKPSPLYSGDINEGYVVGRISGIYRPYMSNDERLIESMIEVPRLSQNVDYIPVVFTEELYKANEEKLRLNQVALIGSYQTEVRYNEKGDKKYFQYFKPASLDFNAEHYKKRNNSLHLGGTISMLPVIKTLEYGQIIYSRMLVKTPTANNSIPFYIRASKANAPLVQELELGDRIEILGRAQSREFRNIEGERVRTNEVSIAFIKSIAYRDFNTEINFLEEEY